MVTRTILKHAVPYFNSGGHDESYRNEILEFDPETKKWSQIGKMREARSAHAVSVVNYEDYAEYCNK